LLPLRTTPALSLPIDFYNKQNKSGTIINNKSKSRKLILFYISQSCLFLPSFFSFVTKKKILEKNQHKQLRDKKEKKKPKKEKRNIEKHNKTNPNSFDSATDSSSSSRTLTSQNKEHHPPTGK
jgi:hypothetical protein